MKALDICWRLLNFCLIFRLPQNMENSHLLNCDGNESINGNNFSDSSGIYYEKEKMAFKDFVHRDSFPSLCSAASDINATEVTTSMSETIYKDAKDKISNEQIQKQNDKNVKPEPNIGHVSDDEYSLTDNGTMPNIPHPSEEINHSTNSLTDIANKWDKWIFELTGKKSGEKEQKEQEIQSLNKNRDDKTPEENNV